MADEGTAKKGREPTPKDARFFLEILTNQKNAPDVDWDIVATNCGYSNANTAKVRFGQIKRALLANQDGASQSPVKGRKRATIVSASTSPGKVTKKRGPKSKKAQKLAGSENGDEKEEMNKAKYENCKQIEEELSSYNDYYTEDEGRDGNGYDSDNFHDASNQIA